MARSAYVYLVLDEEETLYAAFTVKHELVTYLRRLGPAIVDVAAVFRIRDGQPGEGVELDIKELLA